MTIHVDRVDITVVPPLKSVSRQGTWSYRKRHSSIRVQTRIRRKEYLRHVLYRSIRLILKYEGVRVAVIDYRIVWLVTRKHQRGS